MTARIAFTGHRNRTVPPAALDAVADAYPGATWVHGGATGFDSQVDAYAHEHAIPTEVHLPDYALYGRGAPLIRNQKIVAGATALYACYDGRRSGGTLYTIQYAKRLGVPVCILDPL